MLSYEPIIAADDAAPFIGNQRCRKQSKEMIITLSSSRVKPLPALALMLYLWVWHCTMGRRGPEVGQGKIFTAFFWRAVYKKEQNVRWQ